MNPSSVCTMPVCGQRLTPSNNFSAEVARQLELQSQWPPKFGSAHSARDILQRIYRQGKLDNQRFEGCSRHPGIRTLSISLSDLASGLSVLARGLCIICVREEKPQSKCEHNDVTLSCLSHDPIGTIGQRHIVCSREAETWSSKRRDWL